MRKVITLIAGLTALSFLISCTTVERTSVTANWGKKPAITKTSIASMAKMTRAKDSGKRRTVRTTAYSHMENEPGAPGKKNAIGTNLRYGRVRSAAADWSRYPLGTQFKIAGQPHIYEVDDFGSALVGTGTIDLYFPTLSLMNNWGTRHVEIQIIKWGSFERSASILSTRCGHAHCRAMHDDIKPKVKRNSRNGA